MDTAKEWMEGDHGPGICKSTGQIIICRSVAVCLLITAAFYIFVFLAAVSARQKLGTSFLISMGSLLVADFLVLIEPFFQLIGWYWPLGLWFTPMVLAILNKITPLLVTVLAMSRLFCVYKMTTTRNQDSAWIFTTMMTVGAWTIALVMIIVNATVPLTELFYNEQEGYVSYYLADNAFVTAFQILKFVCIGVSFVCYGLAALVLTKYRKISSVGPSRISAAGKSTQSKASIVSNQQRKNRSHEWKVLAQGMLITLCLLTEAVCSSIFLYYVQTDADWLVAAVKWLPLLYLGWFINSCTNPVLYIMFSKAVRDHVMLREKWN